MWLKYQTSFGGFPDGHPSHTMFMGPTPISKQSQLLTHSAARPLPELEAASVPTNVGFRRVCPAASHPSFHFQVPLHVDPTLTNPSLPPPPRPSNKLGLISMGSTFDGLDWFGISTDPCSEKVHVESPS